VKIVVNIAPRSSVPRLHDDLHDNQTLRLRAVSRVA
jgi:hypothetical protein